MIGTAVIGVIETPNQVGPPKGPDEVDALARFGRLASIGESAETICYEMADLLSAVQGRCDLALARDGAADDIRHARGLAMRCSEMVRRLVTFTRGQAQRWSSSLQGVVDRAECYLSLHHISEIPMRVDVPDDIRVACPPTQLQQVLQNLILFARQAIGGGEGKIELRARQRDDQVTIEVAHNGPGIPTAKRKHLFDPFAEGNNTGRGVGLFIAREIVESHDGLIGYFSTLERGTTFRVVLPTVSEARTTASTR